MLCQRCRGLLVRETFDELREEIGRMCLATRCVNCGCIEDSVVLANRLRSPAVKRSMPHGMAKGRSYAHTILILNSRGGPA
jgi:hypothetical protein